MVFSDAALRQMAREYPATPRELLRVSGVGQAKLDSYGDAFIREIAQHLGTSPRQDFPADTRRAPKPLGDTEHDTLRRFRRGQSIEQIARERELKESTVMGHLGLAADHGEAIDLARFVSREAEAELAAAFERSGWANLTRARELLGERYDYPVLRIYRAARRQPAS
jgi:ATP-dependent DNA helicase RecQ